MTKYIRSVSVPSDYNFLNSEVIYYRFGELKKNDGYSNKSYQDKRTRYIDASCHYLLPWHGIKKYSIIPDFLYPIKNIHSNGKSKIIKAFNARINDFCLLKIGAFLGNIEKNNIDSFDRVAWEAHVLKRISNKNYTTNYIDSFVVGNEFFLLEKFIEGDNLGQAIIDNLIKDEESNICSKIFQIVKELHLLGYRMVDLSLNNFMWNQQDLYIIDLEYFYHESSDYYLIENYNQGTIGFVFPELQLPPLLFDLYALYKMIFYINNRQEYIEFVEKVKEIPMNEYNDSFINEMESKVKDKLFEYYSVDIQTDMNKLSYKEHLIFIENFLTNLKKEAMQ